MRVDVAHAFLLDACTLERGGHHRCDSGRFRFRLRHVVRVVRGAVAEHLCVDPRAAPLRGLPVLEQDGARALGHHEAGAGRVERPRGAGRILVLRREPAHRREARQDQRDDARLRAAREHRVGVAALDHLGRLADRVRARRAGGDDRVVGAFDPERDRELPRDGVDEHVRQEVRRDAARPAVAQRLGLLDDARHAADRRAEHDPDPRWVESVQAGVRERLPAGGDTEQHVALELPRVLRRDDLARVEALHLGGDPHRQAVGVERRDPVDAALAGERGAPRRRRIEPERGDGPDPGDSDALHGANPTSRSPAVTALKPSVSARR